jgi:cellulose biosynthesis protein BcsQ
MGKIQLLLLDEDSHYAEKLAAFARTSEFGNRLKVKLFTKLVYVEKQLETDNSPCILLIADELLPAEGAWPRNLCIIRLSDSQSEAEITESTFPSVYRFQPLQQLLARLVAYYKELHQEKVELTKKSTKVVSLFSAIGNSGKTLAAIHLAKELAFRGKRVFYLNLEALNSVSLLLTGTDLQHFSQILYYARTSPGLLGSKLELLKKSDARLGFDYLSPCSQIREAQEMSAEDTKLLIDAIIDLNRYEVIVVDLEASLQPRIATALTMSDHIMWIVLDDLNGLEKTKAMMRTFGSQRGVHYILNKHTGNVYNDFVSADITLQGYLPYIPEWKTVHAPEQMLAHSVFSEQLFEQYEKVTVSPREGVGA